jgi:hypothetical protein
MLEKIGGRKVLLGGVLVLVGACVDLLAPSGLSDNLLQLLTYVGGGFFLGNGLEHFATAWAVKKEATADEAVAEVQPPVAAAPQVDLSQVETAIEELKTGVATVQQGLSFIITKSGLDRT